MRPSWHTDVYWGVWQDRSEDSEIEDTMKQVLRKIGRSLLWGLPALLAIVNASHTRIAGSYLSHFPYDYGFFWIKYY
jgi:hypothetical protein